MGFKSVHKMLMSKSPYITGLIVSD